MSAALRRASAALRRAQWLVSAALRRASAALRRAQAQCGVECCVSVSPMGLTSLITLHTRGGSFERIFERIADRVAAAVSFLCSIAWFARLVCSFDARQWIFGGSCSVFIGCRSMCVRQREFCARRSDGGSFIFGGSYFPTGSTCHWCLLCCCVCVSYTYTQRVCV